MYVSVECHIFTIAVHTCHLLSRAGYSRLLAGNMVQWCLEDGPATNEALALWLQPDGPKVRILSLMFLTRTVPRSIVDTIAKICPNAKLHSLQDIKQDLSEAQDQGLVESAHKAPCQLACLLHHLKSKYIMADAMSAGLSIRQASNSWWNEKWKDMHSIWNLFFKAQSDVEAEANPCMSPVVRTR